MTEEGGGKIKEVPEHAGGNPSRLPANYYYGAFQGVANYQPQPLPPNHSVVGIPQPVPPPGFSGSPPSYYPHGYQTVPGYAIVEGRPFIEDRLPCCGMGIGWFLFITGFFMGGIPWYIGTIMLCCACFDYRERPGLIACAIAATIVFITLLLFV